MNTLATNAAPTATADLDWESLILAPRPAPQIWDAIFSKLAMLAASIANPGRLHRETVLPDRLIAECAWDLWQDFPDHAPSALNAIRQFWATTPSTAGTAVLILDALSLRELPFILAAADKRGITPVRYTVRGSTVPTDTNHFAAALGLASRSQLANNSAPKSFTFASPDVYTDLLDCPFADCLPGIPAKPRLFFWHTWPDQPLIHTHAESSGGEDLVSAEIKRTLSSNDFWALVNALRQGRQLLITSDHGYAAACDFSSEIKDDSSVRRFAGTFGAMRAIHEDTSNPWPQLDIPPRVLRFPVDNNTWLVVIGQRKWKVRGGFPTLCHYGLSLLEATVPVIELPAV